MTSRRPRVEQYVISDAPTRNTADVTVRVTEVAALLGLLDDDRVGGDYERDARALLTGIDP